MTRLPPALLPALLVFATPVWAQEAEPAHWVTRLDAPARVAEGQEVAAGEYRFVTMAPGWHVTMGPGAILYPDEQQVTGRFALESEIFLFPGTSPAGFGLFVGGHDLEGSGAGWLAVLLRRDGAVGMVRREAGQDLTVVPFRGDAAVKPQAGSDVVGNVMRVSVERDSVRVDVNGTQVLAVPRGALRTDGRFGFRVGEGLNLHASSLDVTRRLAAPRGG